MLLFLLTLNFRTTKNEYILKSLTKLYIVTVDKSRHYYLIEKLGLIIRIESVDDNGGVIIMSGLINNY